MNNENKISNATINNPILLEKAILHLISTDGLNIKYIENPTEEMCLIAVKKSGYFLSLINNPTPKVIEEALKENPKRSQYLV